MSKEEGKKIRQSKWSIRIATRYILLQLPGIIILLCILMILQQWLSLSTFLIVIVLALWVVKDVLLFPFLWKAYDGDSTKHTPPMVGARGIAAQSLSPDGYIRVHGELWRARTQDTNQPVARGAPVKVCGIQGLTLLVIPDKGE